MIIAPSSTSQHHSMRMESRSRNRDWRLARTNLVQVTRIGLHAREFPTIEIENLDGMASSTTTRQVSNI